MLYNIVLALNKEFSIFLYKTKTTHLTLSCRNVENIWYRQALKIWYLIKYKEKKKKNDV